MADANSTLITAWYQDIQFRAPPAAELATYDAALDTNALTAAQVQADIEASSYTQNTVNPVIRMYQAAFGRVPDQAGESAWINAYAAGTTTLQALAVLFANSTEFSNRYGATASTAGNTAIITELYQNVLGRTPSASELATWVNYSSANNLNAGQLLYDFASSQEFSNDTANAIVAYQNAELTVPPSEPTTGSLYQLAAAPTTAYTLTTTVDAPGTGAFASGEPSGNSIIYGTFNNTPASSNTYTAGDVITPTGLNNTLSLADAGTGATGSLNGVAATVSGVQTVIVNSGEAVSANTTSGFTGLTQLTVNSANPGSTVTAAGTTNITLNDSHTAAVGAGTDSVQGGQNIIVNETNALGFGSTINVGTVTAPTGTVAVTETISSTQTGVRFGEAINVKGGTTVSITANLTEAAGAGNLVQGQGINVTGTSATTSVSVTQTAPATAAAAIAAATAAVAATAVSAAPGVNKVAAATAQGSVAAVAAVAGVADGVVVIQDANWTSPTLANTITSVTLSNYGSGSLIDDNALATLTLTGAAVAGGTALTLVDAAATPTATTLALNLDGVGGANKVATFFDGNNELKTINVTTAVANDVFSIQDTSLATLTVAGTNTLTLASFTSTKLATVTVSGSAGFNDGGTGGATGLSTLGAKLTAFTTTSSGTITADLNDTNQTFTGSTGRDIITISADATQKITGGSATNNELILDAANTVFNATAGNLTNTNVTGFSVLGVDNFSSGSTWNMASLNPSFNAIDVNANGVAAGTTETFTNVVAGTTISIDNNGDTLSFANADTNGATDSVTVTLNPNGTAAKSALAAGIVVPSLTLQDANSVGIGTVNIVSGGNDFNGSPGAPAMNTITTLVENGLTNLTVTGGAGLTIASLNETGLHQSTSLTITSNETGAAGTTINTFSDQVLGNITFAGTNSGAIGFLTLSTTVTNLTVSNTGTGSASIDAGASFTDSALTNLNLNGAVAFNTNSLTPATATGATTGFTLSGATDNAHVNINLTGAVALATDTITLGNANNNIGDGSTAGIVKVTVGTGSNLIMLGDNANGGAAASTASTASYSVTLGAHTATTGIDSIFVADTGTATPTAATTVITGAVTGDLITTHDANTLVLYTVSASNLTALSNAATLQAAITADVALMATAHGVDAFQYGGNTYVVETVAASTLAATSTVVELMGVHTLTLTGAGTGAFALAS